MRPVGLYHGYSACDATPMWRPAAGSFVCIRHPDALMQRMLAMAGPSWAEFAGKKFRVESLKDYPDGGVEANLQPETGTYPAGHTHTLYTSWLVPA